MRLVYLVKLQERGLNGCPVLYTGQVSERGEYAVLNSHRMNTIGASMKPIVAGMTLRLLRKMLNQEAMT